MPNETATIVRLKINSAMVNVLAEMAKLASTSPDSMAAQLLESCCADFKLRKLSSDFLTRSRGVSRIRALKPGGDVHRTKLSEQRISELLGALDTGVSVSSAAERFCVSRTSVRRVLVLNHRQAGPRGRPRGPRKIEESEE